MITEAEKERLKVLHEALRQLSDVMATEMGVDPDDVALRAQAEGAQLATIDALFAIREGTEWRGMTDPKEIAGRILRDSGIGE